MAITTGVEEIISLSVVHVMGLRKKDIEMTNQAHREGLYEAEGGLLQMVQTLHENLSGSSDTLSYDTMLHYEGVIQLAIDTWEPSSKHAQHYDDCVKALCRAVLLEAQKNPLNRY